MSRRLLLAAGDASSGLTPGPLPDPDPDPDPDPGAAVWRQATNKTAIFDSDLPADANPSTSRVMLTVRNGFDKVRFTIGAHYYYNEPTAEVTATLNGTTYPITFSENPVLVMPGEYLPFTSDEIDMVAEPGDVIDYRICMTPGWRNNSGVFFRGTVDAADGASTTRAVTGEWPGDSGTQYLNAPVRVVGRMTDPETAEAWMLSGDSNTATGWGSVACEDRGVAWTNAGSWGERTQHVANRATIKQRGKYGDTPSPWTHALCNFGTNDLGNGATVAQVQGWLIMHWLWLAAEGAKVYQATILPGSSSTDGWTTVENQTPQAHTPQIEQCNEWFRDGSPLNLDMTPAAIGATGSVIRNGHADHPLAGLPFDSSDAMSSARNSGKLKPGYSADGGHPNATGVAALAAAMVQWFDTI